MKQTTKDKMGNILQDLKDNQFGETIPVKEIENAIMRQCGINHNTINAYKKALLAFGLMKLHDGTDKIWVIIE